jgi:hypothetical protein
MAGEGSEFEFQQGQECSLLHVIQTGYGAHPATYPMGIGGAFPGGKPAEGSKNVIIKKSRLPEYLSAPLYIIIECQKF